MPSEMPERVEAHELKPSLMFGGQYNVVRRLLAERDAAEARLAEVERTVRQMASERGITSTVYPELYALRESNAALRADLRALVEAVRNHLSVYDSLHPSAGAWLQRERFDALRETLARLDREG